MSFVEAWFDSGSRGDTSLADVHVADHPGVQLLGSDPSEVLNGGAAIREFLVGEVTAAGGNVSFEPRDTAAFREGSADDH